MNSKQIAIPGSRQQGRASNQSHDWFAIPVRRGGKICAPLEDTVPLSRCKLPGVSPRRLSHSTTLRASAPTSPRRGATVRVGVQRVGRGPPRGPLPQPEQHLLPTKPACGAARSYPELAWSAFKTPNEVAERRTRSNRLLRAHPCVTPVELIWGGGGGSQFSPPYPIRRPIPEP